MNGGNDHHPPSPLCVRSLSAQSNFAVGAVVNATFGSITEMTFYITALLRGNRAGTRCYEEIVKAALTGTLLGCILFIPVSGASPLRSSSFGRRLNPLAPPPPQGICMIIGGIKHQEQRFNSRSAGVSSALLFISIGGTLPSPPPPPPRNSPAALPLTSAAAVVVRRRVRPDPLFKDLRGNGVRQLLR